MNNILNHKNDAILTLRPNKDLEPVIYLVPHTHYDAIWIFNREDYFHINIEFVLKKAVELMKANSEYRFTIEQTYLLEQVEANYPSLFADITRLTKEKRMEIAGGQYLMSDVMLPHGETLIREILKGKKYIKDKFDQDVIVGWGADEFGFNAQWPQILLGCGYRYFAFRRGVDESKPSEFWWEGLDGSRILSHWMPLGYRAGLDLSQLQKSYRELEKYAASRHILMPSGSGVTLPQPETVHVVKKWNAGIHHNGNLITASSSITRTNESDVFHDKTDKPRIMISTPSEYFSCLERDRLEGKVNLAIRKGEMYSGRFSEVFPDCTSSRMWIKQGVKEYENLLLTLERWHALSELEGVEHDVYDRLKNYWNKLLFMSMHDALPGTGIDEVYDGLRKSFESDIESIRGLIVHCLLHLSDHFYKGTDQDLIVFNSLTWYVRDWVECVLEFDQGKIMGVSHLNSIDPFSTSSSDHTLKVDNKKTKANMRDEDSEATIDIEIMECSPYPDGSIQTLKIGFIAEVPPLGYRVYRIVPGINRYSERTSSHRVDFRNGSNFEVSIDPENGLLSVSKNGIDYFKGNEILLEEEIGDLYYHRDNLGLLKSETGEGVKYGSFKCDNYIVFEGKLTYNIKLRSKYYALRWPYRLTHKLKPMLYRHKFVDIDKEIVVYKSLDRIDFVTHVYDRHPHSRLRVRFQTPCSSDEYWSGTQFGAISRKANLFYKRNESGWVESPNGTFPSLDWIDYSGDRNGETKCARVGISVLHRGIPSHEVRDNSIYLTLLRSIVVLSADGIMGPCVPTPDATEMIPYTFRYSAIPHEKDWRESGTYRHAIEFNMPLISFHLGGREVTQHAILENIIENEGAAERSQRYYHSFLEIEPKNVVLSTLKHDEHNSGNVDPSLVVRIYEAEGKETAYTRLTFYKEIKSASIIDMLENEIQKIPRLQTDSRNRNSEAHNRDDAFIDNNTIIMSIGPFKIVSLRVNFVKA